MAFKRFLSLLAAAGMALLVLVGAAAADPYRIVAFGDSLMAGYQLAPGESFPEKLEEALLARGHDVVISNASVSGDTTSGGLERLDWSIGEDTDLVILGLGANDMLRGIAPETPRANLKEMIERLREREMNIVLAGMVAAPNLGHAYAERFDSIYPDLAEAYDLPLYPFLLDGVVPNRSLLLDDGMHPNAKGVERMVEGFLPVIEPILEQDANKS
jgi:acyl-CoA thioesterase-1